MVDTTYNLEAFPVRIREDLLFALSRAESVLMPYAACKANNHHHLLLVAVPLVGDTLADALMSINGGDDMECLSLLRLTLYSNKATNTVVSEAATVMINKCLKLVEQICETVYDSGT